MHKYKLGLFFSLWALAACSPHPSAGTWLISGVSETEWSKIEVHFEPKVEIYSANSEEPVMQCGWWALSRQLIEMECVRLSDTEKKQKFQLNVLADGSAEFKQQNKMIGKFLKQKD